MKRTITAILALALLIGLLPVTSNAAQGGKLAAMTFDDGPSSSFTPVLLDGLKERNVKVSFFMLGSQAQNNVDLVRRAYNEGHEIANHSWDHPNLCELTGAQVADQLTSTNDVLDRACGAGTKYLVRPPYGNTNDEVENLIQAPMIYWSVDPRDWEYFNAYTVRDNILAQAHDGAVILVHDIHETSVYGALMAIDSMLEDGYEFVTVSDLYRRRGVAMQDHQWYYSCKPNGTDVGPLKKPDITYKSNGNTMTVSITGEENIPIYYTTDGSVPTGSSPVYTGPFETPYPSNIRAIASVDMNGVRSEEGSLIYGQTSCSAPQITKKENLITFSGAGDDVKIHYTTDGSAATLNSPVYTEPFEAPKECYIHAVAGSDYYKVSKETVVYHSANGVLYADVVPNQWYYTPIDFMAGRHLLNGMGDNYFEPNTSLTRAMVAKVIYDFCGAPLKDGWTKTSPFTDVSNDQWYAAAIEWCYQNQLVMGYPDQTFRPDSNITRQEMCAMMERLEKFRGRPFTVNNSSKDRFTDYGDIEQWAVHSVESLIQSGIMVGDNGRIYPLNRATRAEFASIFSRLIAYEEKA